IQDIRVQKENLENEKKTLESMKQEHEQLLLEKSRQKQQLIAEKIDTQDDLENQQATIAELNDKLAELRRDLSDFLGENISAKDIQDAANIASKATGVRKDFLLGELVVETNLGRFTGGCTYKNTRMHSYDIPIFKSIMKELHYGVNDKKVSCAPKSGGYGGAMGVAQFIPSTWNGWKSQIASKTGHNPPDPWSITDGVMGMALKLAGGGATKKSGEKAASMIYYCGTSKPKETYPGRIAACKNYASKVQYWANNYESKL
ncbi:MAG: lytic murein transglycosylase, partial [Candidatus Moraniibacteriota bacterium]